MSMPLARLPPPPGGGRSAAARFASSLGQPFGQAHSTVRDLLRKRWRSGL